MKIKTKKLREHAIIPALGSKGAAGADLYACGETEDFSVTINPGETVMIGTGIAMAIPKSCVGLVFARSGMATKRGLRPANCVGVIDNDYRGEIIVALHNDSQAQETIKAGERIAQLAILPYIKVECDIADELDDTERGAGGFGSTGYFSDDFGQMDFFDLLFGKRKEDEKVNDGTV